MDTSEIIWNIGGEIVNEGKKWTTDEIIEEIKRAVEWLNEKENKQND